MFDFGWSELLLIAVIALIVVGPKELPVLLRTLGRYVAMIKAQATQFRAQIDDAIRDTELETLKDEMTELRDDLTGTMRKTSDALDRDLDDTKSELNSLGRDMAGPKTPATASKSQGVTPSRNHNDNDRSLSHDKKNAGEKAKPAPGDGGEA